MNFSSLLKEDKITQKQLAVELKVSQVLISKWANGKCTPDPTMIILIANKLNHTTDDILNCFNTKKSHQ